MPNEVVILKEKYQVKGTEIMVSIANEALEPSFEKIKSDLINYLRDGLENDTLTIKSQVVEISREKMLYTDQEKFEHLKKKYPALRDLQDKLGLDPEF